MLLHQQDDQMKQSSSMNMSPAKYKYPVSDNHHVSDSKDDIHLKHNTDHESKSHHEASHAKCTGESRGKILASAMQAARANADLRALHSALLNGDISLAADVRKSMEQQWCPMPANNHLGHHGSGAKKKRHSHNHHSDMLDAEIKEDLHSRHSSKSSTSSTADCLIGPLHKYPLFIPNSQEDMLLCSVMDDMDSSNRCTSVDLYEAAMREERLQYIFDHENKRNFSHSIDHPYAWKNGISCLHESLNLPPRSASMDIRTQGIDGNQLQHMSLNLPRGSQQHFFKASMQNPLFDSQETLQSKQQKSSCNIYDGSACSLPFNKSNVSMEYTSARKILTDHKNDHHQGTAFHNLMTTQQESMEFLCKEPENTRTFTGLAARQIALAASEEHLSTSEKRNIQQDMVPASPMKKTDNLVTLAWNADQKHDRSYHNHHTYQSLHNPDGVVHRQKLPHTLSNVPLHQSSSNVSCHKCRPALSGALPHTVSTNGSSHTDLTEIRAIDSSTSNAMGNDYSQSKKHNAIKGWFFRSKKKQYSTAADHLHSPAAPACADSRIADKSHGFDITNAGKVSKSKQQFSIATDTVPKSAPKSEVFSCLATSNAERVLDVATVIDLMELKVLRANSKRDAAMAEVLELRLAIDSIGKKLQTVERHCEKLQTQLLKRTCVPSATPEDEAQMHPPASAGDELVAASPAADESGGWHASDREEYDFCELDSNGHRKGRRAASRKVRSWPQVRKLGYGGEIRRAEQPEKEEFLGAVAEARAGVKEVSRVLLRHVQNKIEKGPAAEMAGDDEAELWRPIATMCRVAASKAEAGTKRRIKEVGFCVEALVGLAFYEHFENVGFDKSGATHVLDPVQRAAAFHTAFLSGAHVDTPTQLLTRTSAVYDPAFERFCSRKIKAVGRAVGCPGQMWPAELLRSFLAAAQAVWLLHSLAFAYSDCMPAIFRVAAESPFDRHFMEQLLPNHSHSRRCHGHHQPYQPTVSLMVVPGFFLRDDIIKCKVLSCYSLNGSSLEDPHEITLPHPIS